VYDFDAVQAIIAEATQVVEAEEDRVFGTGERLWRAGGGAWKELEEAPDFSQESVREKGWQNKGDGLFGEYVGYAPIYKSGYDVDMSKSRRKNIEHAGSGELGKIMGLLNWYNMEEGAGYSKVNMPSWDKPMWDTFEILPGWEMEAPSFAGAVDLVVQAVATIATAPVGGFGGAVLGAAISSVDDLMFTALEVGTGYILPEQGVFQAVQTLLKAGVQVAAQGAFQGYEKQAGGLMAAWGKDFLGEATVNVLQQFTTNAANGFIDAHSLEVEDGKVVGWHFDGDQWAESVYGERALAGYAGSFARSATQNLLKSTAVGFLGEGANNYNALIKTASALAGEGVGSLIDGEFSINVLNLTDILSPFIEDKDLLAKMDMGLFSMNFATDENGNFTTTSRINSAGANMGGLVGLARSVAGLTEAYDNIRIGLSGADEKTAIALRGISTNGQEASQSLFDQILSGETTLQEAYRVAVGEMAKTTATEYGKEIGINFEDLNGFELGVVLAHEAMRNGRKDGEEGQRLETRDAVFAHSDHAMQVLEKYGLGALGYQMVQEAIDYAKMQNGEISQEDFEAYVDGTYDSTEDFWKYTRDSEGIIRAKWERGDNLKTMMDDIYGEGNWSEQDFDLMKEHFISNGLIVDGSFNSEAWSSDGLNLDSILGGFDDYTPNWHIFNIDLSESSSTLQDLVFSESIFETVKYDYLNPFMPGRLEGYITLADFNELSLDEQDEIMQGRREATGLYLKDERHHYHEGDILWNTLRPNEFELALEYERKYVNIFFEREVFTNWTNGFHRNITLQNEFNDAFLAATEGTDIPPVILKSLAATESAFNKFAWNRFGYAGLFQIGIAEINALGGRNPLYTSGDTEKQGSVWVESDFDFKGDSRFNPEYAAQAAAEILVDNEDYLDRYAFDDYTQPLGEFEKWKFILASYNGGIGTIRNAINYAQEKGVQNPNWNDIITPNSPDTSPLNMVISERWRELNKYREISTFPIMTLERAYQ
jgi:hypothetical protein